MLLVPSLKLTFSPLKMDAWNTILSRSFWVKRELFRGFSTRCSTSGGGKLSVPWMRSLTGFGDSPAQLRAHHCWVLNGFVWIFHTVGRFRCGMDVRSGYGTGQGFIGGSTCGSKAISWLLPWHHLAMYGYVYIIHSLVWYGFQSMPCGCYVHTVDGRNPAPPGMYLYTVKSWDKLPTSTGDRCISSIQMLSMMSGSEPSKEPRSWSYVWWILGTLCEGPISMDYFLVSK